MSNGILGGTTGRWNESAYAGLTDFGSLIDQTEELLAAE